MKGGTLICQKESYEVIIKESGEGGIIICQIV
jgi:hypothetical protein